MIDNRGPTESVSSALLSIGKVHIGARALLDINLIWFGYSACLSQWGVGGNLLVQMISSCRRSRGVGVITLRMYSMAGQYDNPIPTRFLAPIDCSKIPPPLSFLSGQNSARDFEQKIVEGVCLQGDTGVRQLPTTAKSVVLFY
jgi:hypothetical protein